MKTSRPHLILSLIEQNPMLLIGMQMVRETDCDSPGMMNSSLKTEMWPLTGAVRIRILAEESPPAPRLIFSIPARTYAAIAAIIATLWPARPSIDNLAVRSMDLLLRM